MADKSDAKREKAVVGDAGADRATTVTRVVRGPFGAVHVHVSGDTRDHRKAVFLTVHDIGSNHSSMRDFVESAAMSEVHARSVFVHVDVTGQEVDAPDVDDMPSIQQFGEQVLSAVLDELQISARVFPSLSLSDRSLLSLHVPLVVGVGEGAGANILVRFALRWPERVLGLVLVHLVSSGVGFLDAFKDRFLGSKRRPSVQPSDMIAALKLGDGQSDEALADDYRRRVQTLNARNVQKYISAYMNRKEIAGNALDQLDVLLVCGARSPFAAGVESVYAKCNKAKTSLLKVDAVDVLRDATDKVAQSVLLFVQGLGLLTSCAMPSGSPTIAAQKTLAAIGRRRTLSMEDYDVPRVRRSSLSTHK